VTLSVRPGMTIIPSYCGDDFPVLSGDGAKPDVSRAVRSRNPENSILTGVFTWCLRYLYKR
jgi:hypothetical protein